MVSESQHAANKKWKADNPDKIASQQARYRERHPEKMRQLRQRHADKKFKENPELVRMLEKRIMNDMGKLARVLYGDEVPRTCARCASSWDLELCVKRYALPVSPDDLERLCRKCREAGP